MRYLAIMVAGLLLTAPATAQTTQVLLKADSAAVFKNIDGLSKEFGAKIDRKVPGLKATILSVPAGEVDKLITSANKTPGISAIETLIGGDYRDLFKNVASGDRNPVPLSQTQIEAVSKLRERASSASLHLFEVRSAGISIDLLKGALTTADGFPRPKGIKLNLAPGVSVDAAQIRLDQRPSGGFVWYGKIDNTDGTASQKSGVASLVVNGNRISGTVAVGSDLYTIDALGDGMHAVVKVNPDAYPLDHPPGAYPPSNPPPAPQRARTLRNQAPPTIRALVLYTPAVRRAVANPEDVAENAVIRTNAISMLSGVGMNLVLAKAAELDYSEKDFCSDLEMLVLSKEAAELRDRARAHVVFLLTTDGPACGLSKAIMAKKDSAFSVVNYDCAVRNYSLAHELGHLLGLRHDLWNDPEDTPFKNGHGYEYQNLWRTVMAKKEVCTQCPRVPIWSNPALEYTDVPSGTIERENEAGVINVTAPILAGFH